MPATLASKSGQVSCRRPVKLIVTKQSVRVTGIARTVADCFKYRNKIGLDVALDALKEALKEQGRRGGRGRRVSIDEIWRYARLDRVANVMRPYLEVLA